jgi:outer membrane protein assembly factor BamE (lipoprotein component of BamABCDE complex)
MLLVTSAGALAVLAVGLWLISPASSAITRANAAQVQKGMTLEEVETILGGPAR